MLGGGLGRFIALSNVKVTAGEAPLASFFPSLASFPLVLDFPSALGSLSLESLSLPRVLLMAKAPWPNGTWDPQSLSLSLSLLLCSVFRGSSGVEPKGRSCYICLCSYIPMCSFASVGGLRQCVLLKGVKTPWGKHVFAVVGVARKPAASCLFTLSLCWARAVVQRQVARIHFL